MKIIDTHPANKHYYPAYNPNKMDNKCLDSVLSQTYRNLSVLLWMMVVRMAVRR